jgi:hypothetical protein
MATWRRWSSWTPPGKNGERIVRFDPVVEGVDHPVERRLPARPLVQRWNVTGHRGKVVPLNIADDLPPIRVADSWDPDTCG